MKNIPDMLLSFREFAMLVVLTILLLVAISNGPTDPNPPAGSSPAIVAEAPDPWNYPPPAFVDLWRENADVRS